MAPRLASGAQAEQMNDVEEGSATETKDEFGFTADERAAWDQMQTGEQDAQGEAEPAPAEPEPVAADATAPPGPPPAETPPAEEDDDSPDVITTDPKTGKAQKTINYNKHQRLMTKAQQSVEQARQASEQARLDNAKLAERLNILNEALMAPPQQTPEEQAQQNPWLEPTISPADDAIGALAQMQRRQAYQMEASTYQQEETQTRLEDQQVVQTFTRDAQAFASSPEGQHFMGPDGAYQFLKNSRLQELGISLFDKDPTEPGVQFTQQEINKMIEDYNAEERWVVSNAIRSGKSPSMAIQKLARGRGWKAPGAAAQAPPVQGNGRQPPPGARPLGVRAPPANACATAPNAVAQLQAEAAGAAASRSLSDGGGAPPPEALTPEALLAMNDVEFGKYVDNLPKERLDALMGRQFPGG